MPLTQINLTPDALLDAGGKLLERGALRAMLARAPEGPVVILLHGYKFSPFHGDASPHGHILSAAPRAQRRAISWPRHLGFTGARPDEGLCLALGWHARGTIWQAYRAAEAAGAGLGHLLSELHQIAPDRPVTVMAHSLGVRVFLCALCTASAGSVARAVLLSGAEFRDVAARAMAHPAGRAVEVLNVTSRENALFDRALERLLAPLNPFRRSLGPGLGGCLPNWIDLRIDDPATLRALRGLGFPVAPPQKRVCHWSSYLRPGLFPLYRAYLRTPARLPHATLGAALPPPAPRRSGRRFPAPAFSLPRKRWLQGE
ncbi:hypothetical protein PSA7680_02063 [Pseudoruegeria aquimaris]|uniref:Alpha/beta hydrolase family protein n=1 Tax=Pseudoruegeria aquimaris TaxID=393663 RepID=A0A1Y5SK27_9RHOB|nr:alpha/beta hydrolase [Pseudoruegeria aquimaris]SLN41426.1 hypothetical protein PSA7680_02063 [Pseudoruegeria aquimaris]